MKPYVTLIGLALLAGCASPQDTCIAQASKDLRGLDAAIAVAEGNIARGYAVENDVVAARGPVLCVGSVFGGRVQAGVRQCSHAVLRNVERPQPLDIEAEERKLASMQARRASLRERTDSAIAACYGA